MRKKLSKNVRESRKKAGGSNVGKYKGVKSFAGTAGGAPKGSYPINTKKRGIAALAYARNAPNPSGIKEAVYKKYPSLAKNKKNRMKKVQDYRKGYKNWQQRYKRS